jgi:nicotinate-nucleotide pyrophosphorylase (carboxylating)
MPEIKKKNKVKIMSREELVNQIITQALAEDLNTNGDVTSLSIFSDIDRAEAIIKVKADGVISGVTLIKPIFEAINSEVEVELKVKDGDKLSVGDEICRVKGSIIAILSGERLVLNLLQKLSGVATQTAQLVSLIEGTSAKLLDTRKTTPNLRILEKEAVIHGGAVNHRFGLFDMIMAKDTHVKAAGGPDKAVLKAREWCVKNGKSFKIEVEVENLHQFEKAVLTHPDRIMLDNMSVEDMKIAVNHRNSENPLVELEASGNVTAASIRPIAESGVDFISVGAITHTVSALDIHLVLV